MVAGYPTSHVKALRRSHLCCSRRRDDRFRRTPGTQCNSKIAISEVRLLQQAQPSVTKPVRPVGAWVASAETLTATMGWQWDGNGRERDGNEMAMGWRESRSSAVLTY